MFQYEKHLKQQQHQQMSRITTGIEYELEHKGQKYESAPQLKQARVIGQPMHRLNGVSDCQFGYMKTNVNF